MSPPSPPLLPLPLPHPSPDLFTAQDLIAAQTQLEEEAAEAVPFSFSHCTYPDGYLRQPLYACRTCLGDAAVCAACSVSCHGEHELVELFVRRDFRCDCGTERMGAGSCCSLRVGEGREDGEDMERNGGNKYDKNFRGEFCWCDKGKTYDPQTETDSMYQCLVCENWMHNECLQGFPSDSDLNPLSEDDFDLLVCQACVKGNPRVRRIMARYAGVPGTGVMLIGADDKVRGRAGEPEAEAVPAEEGEQKDGLRAEAWFETKLLPPAAAAAPAAAPDGPEKRKLEDDGDGDGAHHPMDISPKKKRRTSPSPPSTPSAPLHPANLLGVAPKTPPPPASKITPKPAPSTCRAPPLPPPGQLSVLEQVEAAGGRSNVWLEEGFYDRWCRCEECQPMFEGFPYLLEEETSYDPPEDPEAHRTMEELGMDALAKLPRAQAIDGVVAFQGLSERLKEFLRPHADAGAVITEDLIKQFFSEERERKLAR